MVYKIQKVLLTCVVLSLLLPFIFMKKEVVTYLTLGTRVYYNPRIELFPITIGFLILLILTWIWEKELKKIFGDSEE